MKKSIYSLVLMDDVVRALDEQAYRLGTSRSNLVNQILAEHLCCVTPEMRMREIFDSVAELISSGFQVQERRSDSLMTLRSALQYKYRPTISYKVELEREPGKFLGRVSVQIRSQSEVLLADFSEFFLNWHELEAKALSCIGCTDYTFSLTTNSFTRRLFSTGGLDGEQIGQAISGYLSFLDRSLKRWLAYPGSFAELAPALEKEYRELLDTAVL